MRIIFFLNVIQFGWNLAILLRNVWGQFFQTHRVYCLLIMSTIKSKHIVRSCICWPTVHIWWQWTTAQTNQYHMGLWSMNGKCWRPMALLELHRGTAHQHMTLATWHVLFYEQRQTYGGELWIAEMKRSITPLCGGYCLARLGVELMSSPTHRRRIDTVAASAVL